MKSCNSTLFTISLLLVLAASPAYAEKSYSVSPDTELGRFNVIDGQPVIVIGGGGPAGNALDVKQAEQSAIHHFASGKPLAYPLEGDPPVVSLGEGDGKGTQWTFTRAKNRGDTEIVTVQAANGTFRNWHLDCAETEEKMSVAGKEYTIRRLVLVKEPQHIKQWRRYVVAP